ncbi:ABC transporter ATP-binding protein [Gorillibacterium sp. sgz5001074]|uniref:ABC transporter ATP-binding protein n=1 Tax=Gorillibacterium sp. sgz5001074 TaxID=3446695 RepID=UPI003F680BB9
MDVKQLRTVLKGKNRDLAVVDGIDFRIGKNEVVALVGESGCGKSMTSLSIMGLLPRIGTVDQGEVRFQGRNLLELNKKEMSKVRGHHLAMIFQEPMTSLNPVLTIGRQLTEGIRRHLKLGQKEAEDRADLWLKRVGFPEPARIRKEYAHRLSGGMRQRVMLAMAMACEPRLLIADEPTTALDVTIQAQVLDLMRKLQAESDMSMLFITHDLGVVAEMANRVIVMYAGQIVEQCDVRTLFTAPLHPYTVGLLQSTPKLRGSAGPLVPIPGTVPPAGRYSSGCRFADRCRMAAPECRAAMPELREVERNHFVRCTLI